MSTVVTSGYYATIGTASTAPSVKKFTAATWLILNVDNVVYLDGSLQNTIPEGKYLSFIENNKVRVVDIGSDGIVDSISSDINFDPATDCRSSLLERILDSLGL